MIGFHEGIVDPQTLARGASILEAAHRIIRFFPIPARRNLLAKLTPNYRRRFPMKAGPDVVHVHFLISLFFPFCSPYSSVLVGLRALPEGLGFCLANNFWSYMASSAATSAASVHASVDAARRQQHLDDSSSDGTSLLDDDDLGDAERGGGARGEIATAGRSSSPGILGQRTIAPRRPLFW